jgi:hypothetical protein
MIELVVLPDLSEASPHALPTRSPPRPPFTNRLSDPLPDVRKQVSSKRRKFSPEYREQATKMVIDTSRPIAQVARELGIGVQTLGTG